MKNSKKYIGGDMRHLYLLKSTLLNYMGHYNDDKPLMNIMDKHGKKIMEEVDLLINMRNMF